MDAETPFGRARHDGPHGEEDNEDGEAVQSSQCVLPAPERKVPPFHENGDLLGTSLLELLRRTR